MNEWIVTAGSLVVVLVMVAVAAGLGFRRTAELDEARVRELAGAEGAALEDVVIAANKRSAFARLAGGKVMIARVMGADVSTRIAPVSAAHVRVAQGKLSVAFADLGYPPLNMGLESPPAWLTALAGDAS